MNDTKPTKKEPAFSLPGKPAKFPKLKPKPVEPEPEPEPLIQLEEEVVPAVVEPPQVVELEAIEEQQELPELEPVAPAPEEDEPIAEEAHRESISPSKLLPPKLGINGFERIGMLVLRAALENGLDVKAINDPFIPVHYMVYMLKFDIAHSHKKFHKKEMQVRESPTGGLIVNGRVIHVFDEKDVTKIPWDLAGVNYVVEGSEALSSVGEARNHLRSTKKGMRIKHIIEEEEKRRAEPDLIPEDASPGDPYALRYGGCKNVVIAGPSADAPLFAVGVNEDTMTTAHVIKSHVSPAASALLPVLHILHKNFGIKLCSYTLLKSTKGATNSSTMKCPNLGPNAHTKSVKWDFSENLVPAPLPKLEEEVYRVMPSLHGKLGGMCVYVPTPEVSMFDLTIQMDKESDTLYR